MPAVTLPPSRNTGSSEASFSSVVSARMPSSLLTSTPAGVTMGMISRAKMPVSRAPAAFCCEPSANASMSSRLTSQRSATFSAVTPISM